MLTLTAGVGRNRKILKPGLTHSAGEDKTYMAKTFVLDTNVLLHDPHAYTQFKDHLVIIPLKVIEEIDKFKREISERGRNARQIARELDELRISGSLCKGIDLKKGGRLRVEFPDEKDPLRNGMSADNQILQVAVNLHQKNGTEGVFLVSKDINLRLKADALGLQAEDYENGHVETDEVTTGRVDLAFAAEELDAFKEEGRIPPPTDHQLKANQYVVMHQIDNDGHHMLGRFDQKADRIVALIPSSHQMLPIHPRNDEQEFAIDALLNDDIKLVSLVGIAGSGKTLLAVAMGVYKTVIDKTYDKLLVSRPTLPMGKDIGFLPGDLDDKMGPWMQPIYDALDLIKSSRFGSGKRGIETLLSGNLIDVEPLTYIRGRSIPNQFMIVDEAQNLTPREIKTVITRVGHGTKIILTGDIYQIDNPYVDVMSNGLNAVAERFQDYPVAAHVLLKQGVRSRVAELAANIL